MQINLTGNPVPDDSVDPAAAPLVMRTLAGSRFQRTCWPRAAAAKTRTWRFGRSNGAWTVNGKFFDENVVNAAIPAGSEETWVISNFDDGWRHPVHIHFEEHRTLSRNGVLVSRTRSSTPVSITPARTWSNSTPTKKSASSCASGT